MNWKTLFKSSEVVTSADRLELEKLESGCESVRALAAKIDLEWTTSTSRIDRLRELGGAIAEDPANPELYRRLEITACMPSNLNHGWQHRDIVLDCLNKKIEQLMAPQHAIIRRCLSRALDQAEAELKKTTEKERRAAEAEGFPFSPSGKILALQQRILSLRNAVAAPVPGEDGCHQTPGDWRTRLAEWL